jgi:hypothetical protein
VVGMVSGATPVLFGLQLASAAPAATVAVSLMNVRREREGRRVMGILRVLAFERNNNNV